MRLLAILLLLAGPAAAEGWSAFYSARPASVGPDGGAVGQTIAGQDVGTDARHMPASVCMREIVAAQTRHGIPGNLLLAIGIQEAGTQHRGTLTIWPHAVNAAGDSHLFDSRRTAIDYVRRRQAGGTASIDVGCMQINLRWHPNAFPDLETAFDPAANVAYAARFLTRLKAETGSWRAAAGAYHSRTEVHRAAYLDRLDGNIRLANDRAASLDPAPVQRTATPPPRMAWGAGLGGPGAASPYSALKIGAAR